MCLCSPASNLNCFLEPEGHKGHSYFPFGRRYDCAGMVEGVTIPDSEDAVLMGGSWGSGNRTWRLWLSWGWAVGDCMCARNSANVGKDCFPIVAALGGSGQMGHSKVPSGRSQERSWSKVGSAGGWFDAMELVDGVQRSSVEEKLVVEKGGELMGIPPLPLTPAVGVAVPVLSPLGVQVPLPPEEEEEASFEDASGVSDTPPAVWLFR